MHYDNVSFSYFWQEMQKKMSRTIMKMNTSSCFAEEDNDRSRLPSRRSRQPPRHLISDYNGDLHVRRSNRQRKLLYSTFNQNLIDKHLAIMARADPASSAEEDRQPSRRSMRQRDVSPKQDDVCCIFF